MGGGVLVSFHCGSNAGYAIGRLETVFLRLGTRLTGEESRVFFSYTDLRAGAPSSLPSSIGGILQIKPNTRDSGELPAIRRFVQQNNISTAILFDQQPGLPIYRMLRAGGVSAVISYWGAPMSSLQSPLRLLFKKLEVSLSDGPDLYIFESEAMRATATHGRGVPKRKTAVVYLGVDPSQFRPAEIRSTYAHEVFGIPLEAQIILYSGHMEPRKGVAVILRAAVRLAEAGRRDVYFLLLGNREHEEVRYAEMYLGTAAERIVIFGGYRNDIAELMRSASVGVIASTGWDSFTRAAVEMAASGLPLVVSRLQGLVETVEEGVTGLTFDPGNDEQLASILSDLVDNPEDEADMARQGESGS